MSRDFAPPDSSTVTAGTHDALYDAHALRPWQANARRFWRWGVALCGLSWLGIFALAFAVAEPDLRVLVLGLVAATALVLRLQEGFRWLTPGQVALFVMHPGRVWVVAGPTRVWLPLGMRCIEIGNHARTLSIVGLQARSADGEPLAASVRVRVTLDQPARLLAHHDELERWIEEQVMAGYERCVQTLDTQALREALAPAQVFEDALTVQVSAVLDACGCGLVQLKLLAVQWPGAWIDARQLLEREELRWELQSARLSRGVVLVKQTIERLQREGVVYLDATQRAATATALLCALIGEDTKPHVDSRAHDEAAGPTV